MGRPRELKAIYDANTISVYQLVTTKEATRAIRDNSLAHLSTQKSLWVQPSFVWSFVRSDFGRKMKVLKVEMSKEGFLWALENSCLSKFEPTTVHPTEQEWKERRGEVPVEAKWEPDLKVLGESLDSDCLRLGFTGEAVTRYVQEWVVNVYDMSKEVYEYWAVLNAGLEIDEPGVDAELPREEHYPALDETIVDVLAMNSQ